MLLLQENIVEYQEKGYTILRNALTDEELSLLHHEADILTNHLISEGVDLITDIGCIIEPWTCGFFDATETNDNEYKVDRNKYGRIRDTIYWQSTSTESSSEIILHKYGRTWASQLLGAQRGVYLLNEQFIVKPPSTAQLSQFAWHRDSDYYQDKRHREENTVACWTALDAVNEANGTVQIEDYLGQNKILEVPAGTVVFMSNQLLHKSTGNSSRQFRRAYMAQFSTKPLVYFDKQQLPFALQCVGMAVLADADE